MCECVWTCARTYARDPSVQGGFVCARANASVRCSCVRARSGLSACARAQARHEEVDVVVCVRGHFRAISAHARACSYTRATGSAYERVGIHFYARGRVCFGSKVCCARWCL
eukprot:471734-Pleurochrysis_carterae.AAC.6